MKIWQLSLASIVFSFFIVWATAQAQTSFKPTQQFFKNTFSITGTYNHSQSQAHFLNQKIPIPQEESFNNQLVLGKQTRFGNIMKPKKKIYVDLGNQRIYAYENDQLIYNFLVSTGKWGRTPTGRFKIWIKLRYTLMTGGSQELGTYYYLPNVPFTMFFYNDQVPQNIGYGIHGTYWHDNFGHPMSHGCINMRNEDVEQLYYWAEPNLNGLPSINATDDNPGTEIIIYGQAPAE